MAKRFLILIVVCNFIISACNSSRQLSSYTDDVYANPSELKLAVKKQAEEQAKLRAAEKQRIADSVAAKKARDDANPYYKDPSYNKDDYYDYEYASRINRFNNPINGAGYYDNYYTNLYTYNQNPSCYGQSIYSTYNYMPSAQFGVMSAGYGNSFYNGYSMSYGNCNPYYSNYYNPYGYNPYYSTGYYNGYNTGYYNGYYGNNYYNNGWGYLNTYDPNSGYSVMEHAPRGGSHGNPNSGGRNSETSSGRGQLYNSFVEQQNNTPRFNNVGNRISSTRANGGQMRENNNSRNTTTTNYNPSNGNQTNFGNNINSSSRTNNQGNRATHSENNNNSWQQNNSWNNESRSSGGNYNNGGGSSSPRGGGSNIGGGRGGR